MDSFNSYIIYRCVIGSRAYGLDTEGSDTDVRGIYLPPARLHWSLSGVPEQLINQETQNCFWELEKFLKLALRSNPNILECLNTSLVEYASPLARELLGMKQCFPSKLAYNSYQGYADAQIRKLASKRKDSGQIDWKHAMHVIRLMLGGLHLLETGEVAVHVGEHRDFLLSIKRGEAAWERVESLTEELRERMHVALSGTPLPDEPDTLAIDEFLIRARRSMVED